MKRAGYKFLMTFALVSVMALPMLACKQDIAAEVPNGVTPNPGPPNPNPGESPTPTPGPLTILGPVVAPEQPAGVISGTITISATVTGPRISQVQFFANGSPVGNALSAPYEVQVNTALLTSPVRIKARAYALGGSQADTPELTYTIDNAAPQISSFTVVSGNPSDPVGTLSGTSRLTIVAADDHGIGKVEFKVDGTVVNTDTTDPFTFDLDTTTFPNGPHEIIACVYDGTAAGNPRCTDPEDIFINNGGPAITITSPTPGQFLHGTITISASASDPSGVTELIALAPTGLVDTNPNPAIFSAALDTTALPEGDLTISLRARGGDGRLSFKSIHVTVDNVPFDGSIALNPPFFTGGDFGSSVAMVGDVNHDGFDDVAIGSPNADIASINDGVVVVFFGPTFTSHVVINNPEPTFNSRFGSSITPAGDIDGDGNADIAIGAPGAQVGGLSNSGKVYVFKGPNFSQRITIANPQTQSGEEFGFAIAGGKNIDGAGGPDLIITAPKWNFDQFNLRYGRAYLVKGPAFTDFTLIPNPNPQWDSRFGETAAIIGDSNGDGKADYAIGSPNYDESLPNQQNSGRVYVYQGPSTLIATLKDPAPQASAYFGSSLASAGDLNGDGKFDLLIGESGYNTGTGRAYIALAPGFALSAPLTRPSGHTNDLFGASVAGAGDLNNDGNKDIAVGAPNADEAVIFLGPNFTSTLVRHHPSGATGINFGVSMAGGGDVNHDGLGDLIVGASSAPPVGGGAVFFNP